MRPAILTSVLVYRHKLMNKNKTWRYYTRCHSNTAALYWPWLQAMKQFRKNCRKTLAGFMSIWLSGIALLLFCQLPARAAGSDFCPLARASKGHCDHAAKTTKSDLITPSTSEAFDCCGFIPAVF